MEVQWLEDDANSRILIQRFLDPWTTEEYVQSVEKALVLTDSVAPDPIYQIIDMSGCRLIPAGIPNVCRMVSSTLRDNVAVIVVVDIPPVVEHVLKIMGPFMPNVVRRLRHVDTLDDAFEYIDLARQVTGDTMTRAS